MSIEATPIKKEEQIPRLGYLHLRPHGCGHWSPPVPWYLLTAIKKTTTHQVNKQAYLLSVYHLINSGSSEVALYKTSKEEKYRWGPSF